MICVVRYRMMNRTELLYATYAMGIQKYAHTAAGEPFPKAHTQLAPTEKLSWYYVYRLASLTRYEQLQYGFKIMKGSLLCAILHLKFLTSFIPCPPSNGKTY